MRNCERLAKFALWKFFIVFNWKKLDINDGINVHKFTCLILSQIQNVMASLYFLSREASLEAT